MKKILFTVLFIVFLVSPSHAFNPLVVCAGQPVAGGDGSIGQTSHTNNATSYDDFYYWSAFTPTNAGPINYGHAYISGTGTTENVCITIFNSSGEVLAYGAAVSSSADAHWQNNELNTEITLQTGVTYFCGVNHADQQGLRYYSGTGTYYYDAQTYSDTPSNVSPGGDGNATGDVAIIFNNTAGSPE